MWLWVSSTWTWKRSQSRTTISNLRKWRRANRSDWVSKLSKSSYWNKKIQLNTIINRRSNSWAKEHLRVRGYKIHAMGQRVFPMQTSSSRQLTRTTTRLQHWQCIMSRWMDLVRSCQMSSSSCILNWFWRNSTTLSRSSKSMNSFLLFWLSWTKCSNRRQLR